MKQIRSCIAALGLVFVLALAACETPTSNGGDEGLDIISDDERTEEDNGPADGTPWEFENLSSYPVNIYPNDDEPHPDQGWKAFSVPAGESRTIRVNKDYTDIFYRLAYPDDADIVYERVEGEEKYIFKDKDT
jgi:hypothetical protein